MTDLEIAHNLQKFYDILANIATSLDSIATGVLEINRESLTTFKQNRQHHADLMACLEKLTESK